MTETTKVVMVIVASEAMTVIFVIVSYHFLKKFLA